MTGTRFGVIDIGSNTIRSMVVQTLPEGSYRILDDEKETARLASGLDESGRLSRASMERAVAALSRMAAIMKARGVRSPAVVATSALRNASNRERFVERVRRTAGLRVRVISGDEEARLAFESAALCFDLGDAPCGVIDVGGGSTEVVLAMGTHIQGVHSLEVGAVALTEACVRSDPPRGKEMKEMRAWVRAAMDAAGLEASALPRFVVASGGTASALAQIALSLRGLAGRSAQGLELTQADVLHILRSLQRRTLAERRALPGLSADRADIILAGATILYEAMARLRVNLLKVSTRGIRHALLNRMIARRTGAAPSRAPRPDRIESALAFARALRFEEGHARQVRRIAESLWDQLAEPLGLPAAERDLLTASALLHDVGYVVAYRSHHKHAYHLIAHAPLDGFTPAEREVIALAARYHRRSLPQEKHVGWAALPRRQRETVRRLASILRIADALDRRHSGRLGSVKVRAGRSAIRIGLVGERALDVELHAAREKTRLFEKVFGLPVTFAATATSAAPSRARRLSAPSLAAQRRSRRKPARARRASRR